MAQSVTVCLAITRTQIKEQGMMSELSKPGGKGERWASGLPSLASRLLEQPQTNERF